MKILLSLFILAVGFSANADYYKCSENVYKDGWFRKYEVSGKTWGANIRKHGILSSTWGSSVEKTTSSSDPGVSTGNTISGIQFSSSWGECSALDMLITKQMREEYIDQNFAEIKKQVAIGEGHHVDSLAFMSGCKNIDGAVWSQVLQSNTEALYDAPSAGAFADKLNSLISADADLKDKCSVL